MMIKRWFTHAYQASQSYQQPSQFEYEVRTGIARMEKMIMALSEQVKALVDEVAQNTSIEASATMALTTLVGKIADLEAQIAALGAGMSAEDLAAVQDATKALSETAVALQAAVPLNTNTNPANPAAPSA